MPLNGKKKNRERCSAVTAKVLTVNKETGQRSARIIICFPAPIIIATADLASIYAELRLITHKRLWRGRRKTVKKKKECVERPVPSRRIVSQSAAL